MKTLKHQQIALHRGQTMSHEQTHFSYFTFHYVIFIFFFKLLSQISIDTVQAVYLQIFLEALLCSQHAGIHNKTQFKIKNINHILMTLLNSGAS